MCTHRLDPFFLGTQHSSSVRLGCPSSVSSFLSGRFCIQVSETDQKLQFHGENDDELSQLFLGTKWSEHSGGKEQRVTPAEESIMRLAQSSLLFPRFFIATKFFFFVITYFCPKRIANSYLPVLLTGLLMALSYRLHLV